MVPYCICFLPKNIGVCVSELKNAKHLTFVYISKVKILPKTIRVSVSELKNAKDLVLVHVLKVKILPMAK